MPLDSSAPLSLSSLPVFRAANLKAAAGGGSWKYDNLVGILAEISEEGPSGAASFAVEIIAEAQGVHEPVAWVAGTESIFFPPDFLERGIDLSALTIVRAGGGKRIPDRCGMARQIGSHGPRDHRRRRAVEPQRLIAGPNPQGRGKKPLRGDLPDAQAPP